MISKFIAVAALSFTTLTAYPAIIAKAEFTNGDMLYFTDEQRKCPEGTKGFEYVPKDRTKKTLQGCYMPTPRGLYVVDEEGDSGIVPWEVLKQPGGA